MAKKKLKEKRKTEVRIDEFSSARRPVSTRGRIFEGLVIRKFPKRITIEFERTIKIPKYERFLKKKTKIHARLPDSLAHDIHIGDLIRLQECRPLSKIIHFIVIKKIKSSNETQGK